MRTPRFIKAVARMAIAGAFIIPVVAVVTTATPSAAYRDPLIWVGSPVPATWGESPATHLRLAKAQPTNDWATDLAAPAGEAAYLYVAPSDSRYNGAVSTRISQIIDDNACRDGGGGDLVTVQIFYNGASYGQVTYAHLSRNSSLYVGQWVGRWGTWLGTVGNQWAGNGGGVRSNCWTGPHVHTELRATTDYACWNRGYVPYQSRLARTNFIGFVSGPLGRSATACP